MKLLTLGCVACLIVGAGLLSAITFERQVETLKERESLLKNRVSIIADPRSGELAYDWMYLHNVTIPTRWQYTYYAFSFLMIVLAVWLMVFRRRERDYEKGSQLNV